MPRNPATLWIVGASGPPDPSNTLHTIQAAGRETVEVFLELHSHYGPVRRDRRVRSLLRKYRGRPDIHVFTLSPTGETTEYNTGTGATLPSETALATARRGGTTSAASRTPAQRSAIAQRAARARWNKGEP